MIRFDDAICIAMCQKGLRDRMLHNLWIPVLFVVPGFVTMIAAEDAEGLGIWMLVSAVVVGCVLVRFAYLCLKCYRLVQKLQGMDQQEIDLQISAAHAWGGSVYLLDAFVFAPQYFLLVPYAEIERFRTKTWKRFAWVVVDVQLTFYTAKHRRYKTMLKKPEQFDHQQFQVALQAKKNACPR